MSPNQYHLFFLIGAIATIQPSSATSPLPPPRKMTAYEVLESYDLPIERDPSSRGGELRARPSTGKFTAKLNRGCRFTVDKFKFKVKDTVSGTLQKGKVKEMRGISIKAFLFFFDSAEVGLCRGQLHRDQVQPRIFGRQLPLG